MRVRSCGLVKKRANAGKQVDSIEQKRLGVCRIGGLLHGYHSGDQHSHHKLGASIGRRLRRVNKNRCGQ
jgi:hypothetical protein